MRSLYQTMRDTEEIKSDIIRSLRSAKADMENAGVSATSDGNMTEEEFSALRKRVLNELEPISRELG